MVRVHGIRLHGITLLTRDACSILDSWEAPDAESAIDQYAKEYDITDPYKKRRLMAKREPLRLGRGWKCPNSTYIVTLIGIT